MSIIINQFDGFRVEVNNEESRGDIILSRPPLNVIQYSQRIKMAEAMRDLDKNENVRVIVLRADGKHFSSGGNIEGFMNETPETLTMLAQNVMTPEKIRKPVITSIQGYCFGVGFEFSLACDFRIVTRCAQLSLPEMKIGMIPGSGGSVRLSRMIGLSRVKDMIMRGKRISGEEAYNYGLASEVVEINDLESATKNLVKELCLVSPLAQRAIKTVLNASQDAPLHVAIELEGETYGRLRSSSDFKEGVKSFVEKRKPVYTGQ
ncbi:enoyl-CoA hydratase/isomerase family protein [Alphaproteobacteria bacterium]|nr:enoyl-CoA hydratase/isomerase family protein [Alphaproteobacteria bacterium]